MSTEASVASKIPHSIEKRIGKLVCESVRNYFKNKEHREAFEEWYLKTYGKKYIWRKEKNGQNNL